MEVKKSPKADLENKKLMFTLIGYVFVLSILFVAFEWSDKEVTKHDLAGASEAVFEEEIVPITVQENTPPPPPPPAPVIEEILNIVEDDAKIEQVDIASSEDDQKKKQTIVFAPPPVEKEEEDTQIFTVVEEMPKFPGGETALLQFINKSVKYPVIAQENGIQGRVIVSFVVEKDGRVVDAVVVRGVDPSLDKEALRVIGTMPHWTPGKQRGKAVRVKYTVPISFRLQ